MIRNTRLYKTTTMYSKCIKDLRACARGTMAG